MSTDVWTKSYIRDLSEAELEKFQEMVSDNVKGSSSSEERTILNNNLELWLYCLQVMRRDVELKLSRFKTNFKIKLSQLQEAGSSSRHIEDMRIAEEKWRSNAMKFLNSVEKKMLYVKLMLDEEEIIDEED